MPRPSFLKINKKDISLYFTFFLSVFYLAFLLSSTQKDLFFSGDGGVKFMVTKQLSEGLGFKYLHLTHPQWVRDIWNKGFFPFSAPFLYDSPKGYIFSFPPAFQIISSFFYSKFGYTGLYIIPFTSLVLLWLGLVRLLIRYGVRTSRVSLALFIFVFCSPVTLYGATYWEHTLALLFLFGGFSFLMETPARLLPAFLLGLFSGLSVWLRPEALLMNILYAGVAFFLYKGREKGPYGGFLVGLSLSIGGFLLFNKIEYGALLGVHSYQILEEHGLFYNLKKGLRQDVVINWMAIGAFPFVIFTLPLLYRFLRKKWPFDEISKFLLLVVVSYSLLAPFMLPNVGGKQWGVRYFLPVLPILVVLLAGVDRQWKLPAETESRSFPVWARGLFLLVTGYSLYLNTVEGGLKELRAKNYTRVKPLMDFVKKDSCTIVVVSSGFIPSELSAIFDKKYFFLAEEDSTFHKLLPYIKEEGVKDFLYIGDRNRAPGLRNLLNHSDTALVSMGDYYVAKYVMPGSLFSPVSSQQPHPYNLSQQNKE